MDRFRSGKNFRAVDCSVGGSTDGRSCEIA
jgi:hypothetical protein